MSFTQILGFKEYLYIQNHNFIIITEGFLFDEIYTTNTT